MQMTPGRYPLWPKGILISVAIRSSPITKMQMIQREFKIFSCWQAGILSGREIQVIPLKVIYVGEQIKLNGSPTIEGFIIAKDKANTDDHVEQNSISGNPTITFSGSLDTPFTINTSGDVSLTIVSWNEL